VDKLRVAILIPGFNLFGQERALLTVSKMLREMDVDVTVLLHHEWGKKALQCEVDKMGLPSFTLPFNTIWSLRIFAKAPLVFVRNLISVKSSSKQFLEIVKYQKIDVLIAGNWSFAYYVLPALKRCGIGFVYRHGDSPPVSNFFARKIASSIFDRVNLHVANCDFVRSQLLQHSKIENVALIRNYPHIPNVTALQPQNEIQKPTRLLFAGQMSVHKGVNILLDSFDILASQHSDLELVLAGASPGVGKSQQDSTMQRLQSSKARWGERIIYVGHVDSIATLFTDRTIHVCPSIWDDPSPNVIFEAKAYSTPTVAFNRGGIPELIRAGIDGDIVSVETAKELAAAISKFIETPKVFNDAKIEAKKSLDDFSDYGRISQSWMTAVRQASFRKA
jgi:glycosyltransferase involved in cell wall biosynthesis